MKTISVPKALITATDISASAKVVWMVAALQGVHGSFGALSPIRVAEQTGSGLRTVCRAIGQLAASRWSPDGAGSPLWRASSGAVSIPAHLITDAAVRAGAKVLYGVLQLVPGFHYPTCLTTFDALAELAYLHRQTTRRSVLELAATGWLDLNQAQRYAPLHITLCNPVAEGVAAEASAVRRRVEKASFRGEALMREYLNVLVATDQFEDDAAPGFLVNPRTKERLQFDRYYPSQGVAFEFNGPQHYRATRLYTREEATLQRTRDYIKGGICLERGIKLVVAHAEDLTLARMRRKVGDLLPQRDLTDLRPVLDTLESISREHRRAVKRIRAER